MTGHLWTPWRMTYILGEKTKGCVFCHAIAAGKEAHEQHLILRESATSFVIMNKFPYAHGHVMVIPKRHVANLEDLSMAEARELFDGVVMAQTALKACFHPQGMNIGMNLGEAAGAGIEDHLHVHVVPRWNGDTNFMPMIADVRVMPEHLLDTYHKLLVTFEAQTRHGE